MGGVFTATTCRNHDPRRPVTYLWLLQMRLKRHVMVAAPPHPSLSFFNVNPSPMHCPFQHTPSPDATKHC